MQADVSISSCLIYRPSALLSTQLFSRNSQTLSCMSCVGPRRHGSWFSSRSSGCPGEKVAGVVFNMVNERAAQKYGKYAYQYYYGARSYKKYYDG